MWSAAHPVAHQANFVGVSNIEEVRLHTRRGAQLSTRRNTSNRKRTAMMGALVFHFREQRLHCARNQSHIGRIAVLSLQNISFSDAGAGEITFAILFVRTGFAVEPPDVGFEISTSAGRMTLGEVA